MSDDLKVILFGFLSNCREVAKWYMVCRSKEDSPKLKAKATSEDQHLLFYSLLLLPIYIPSSGEPGIFFPTIDDGRQQRYYSNARKPSKPSNRTRDEERHTYSNLALLALLLSGGSRYDSVVEIFVLWLSFCSGLTDCGMRAGRGRGRGRGSSSLFGVGAIV
jgi:hypothetical protein